MKQAVALAFALALGSLPYALAEQQAKETRSPVPAALTATSHASLPTELSHYWFVPEPSDARVPDARRDFLRGVEAVTAGDFATALTLVSSSDLNEPRLTAYAGYYRALALQGLARLPEADAVLTALTESRLQGFLEEAVRLTLADVALARGDGERAERMLRALTDRALSAPGDAFLKLGQAEEAVDHRDHAIAAYRSVYYRFPLGEQAVSAKAAIDRLTADGTGPAASQADELSRAERLFAARRWADARDAFESLARVASGKERTLATIRLAESSVRLGRHRAARDGLRPYLADSTWAAEARFFDLNAVRGLGDRQAYVTLSRALVDDFPDSTWAAEALNDLASYYVVGDQDAAADRVFRELLVRFPRHRYSERAAWKVGWAAYRDRQFGEAATVFESAAATFPRADYRPAWLYWSGRARDQIGDEREAVARYQIVVADYGSSYYGRLVSRLIASRPGLSSPAGTRAGDRAPAGAPLAAPPTEGIMRALMAAGLFDDALREVQYAQRTWGDSPRLQATYAWIRHRQAQRLRADERFAALRGAITTMRRAYPQFLSAEGENLPAEILRIIYPLDYWDLIQKYASAHGLDPYLVAALMAQESSFTAEVRSPADARGLMQIMPATGRLYARRLGIGGFTTASLSRPDVNVRIGARYFKDLMDRFGGPHYALAGYNAGEGRVARWLKEHPDLPPDEFIDSIPFPETQNYVKRILGTAEDYRRLYGTGSPTNTPLSAPAAD